MEFRRIKLIIGFVSFGLLSLIAVQIFWAFSSYKLNERNIHSKTMDAMNKTMDAVNDNISCFEMFSKIPINPHEGFYMIRQKWDNDKYISKVPNSVDTVPMYYEHADENLPFNWNDMKFNNPMDLEIILKFHYVVNDSTAYTTERNIPQGVNLKNFQEKLSDKESIVSRYDTLLVDSILKAQLSNYAIADGFHFGYLKNEDNKIEYSTHGANTNKLLNNVFRVQLTRNKYFNKPYDLVLYFDDYNHILFSGIRNVLIVSLLVTFILLISFYLFIRVIYRQRKLSELKNDFINNMTHEFKTPLANISVALETLSSKGILENEPNAKVYGILGQETERLRENIEKILQVAQFEKEKIHLTFEQLDLHQVLLKAASSFEPVLLKRDCEIQFIFEAKKYMIEADETHLINVFCNLLDNAIKYSQKTLQITITTRNNNEGVSFTIKDAGQGISKEAQKKIFEKFYREPTGDIHTIKGFGLGLTYVKTIIDSHHGKISVKSYPSEGTEFEIYFPFKQLR
ncbi:MAG: HAMP domain-containing sensor histidine kinase [Bacteroidota bacterium]